MQLLDYLIDEIFSVDLKKKAISLVEKKKSKYEIGIATLCRWLNKKANGESLNA